MSEEKLARIELEKVVRRKLEVFDPETSSVSIVPPSVAEGQISRLYPILCRVKEVVAGTHFVGVCYRRDDGPARLRIYKVIPEGWIFFPDTRLDM